MSLTVMGITGLTTTYYHVRIFVMRSGRNLLVKLLTAIWLRDRPVKRAHHSLHSLNTGRAKCKETTNCLVTMIRHTLIQCLKWKKYWWNSSKLIQTNTIIAIITIDAGVHMSPAVRCGQDMANFQVFR